MSVRQLKIDGITVPVWGHTQLQQSYDPIEAVDQRRTANGTMVQRILWDSKLRTRVTGGGPAPSGLKDIDTSASFALWCVAPLARNGTTTITLPDNRRSDSGAEPLAFADVNGVMVPTTITNLADILADVTDDATIQAVSGASQYQIRWFPILTVFARPIRETLNRGRGFNWVLEAEEA